MTDPLIPLATINGPWFVRPDSLESRYPNWIVYHAPTKLKLEKVFWYLDEAKKVCNILNRKDESK